MLGSALAAIFLAFGLAFGVRRLMARRLLTAPRRPARRTPVAIGLQFQELSIPTENGKSLAAWHIPASRPGPGILLMHGWGGNAATLLPLTPLLHQAGYTLLLPEARNHGRSTADGPSSMVRFAQDLEHGLKWLERCPEVDGGRLGIIGFSAGGAAALLVASRNPGLRAVVSIGAFSHSLEMVHRRLAALHMPFRPLSRWVARDMERLIDAEYNDIAPVNTIGRALCPVLLVHGGRDREVPTEDARRIFSRRPGDHVQLWILPRAGHHALSGIRRDPGELLSFFDRYLISREHLGEGLNNG